MNLYNLLNQDYMFSFHFSGWATAEYLTTKLIPLWVGARAIEFNWVHTQLSFDANISLVCVYFTFYFLGKESSQNVFLQQQPNRPYCI